MSDFSRCELEDILWDDFGGSDDHIVPHPSNDHGSIDSCEEGNCKKPWQEVTPVQIKDMPGCISSSETGTSSHCVKNSNVISGSEFRADDCILNDTSSAAISNSYDYSLSHIPQTDDLNLFSNDCKNKESSDLLYYGWPDIGNLEDVDAMLSNCDSLFGLGITGNKDELVWFTSEDLIGGSEEALKMDFKFPCPEPSALTDTSQHHEPPESNNHRNIYVSERKDEFKRSDQIKQSKHENQREGMKTDRCLGNDGSFYHVRDLGSNDNRPLSIDVSDRVFTTLGNQQQKKGLELDASGYMPSNTYLHLNYSHAPNETVGGRTGLESENKGLVFPSSKESSCTSNQDHSMETSCDPPFKRTAAKVDELRKVHHSHEFPLPFAGNQGQTDVVFEGSKYDLVSAPKQVHTSGNKLESQSDAGGDQKGASAEIGLLNVPESSSISSELDEISQEATSFHQLKQVMEQLDFRTKLCIRDSLYRLARSAEQRHDVTCLSGSSVDCKDTCGPLMTGRTNKCSEFMDMETDTNPIDRSIAHLLFHRPSDSSKLPAAAPLKPNATIRKEGVAYASDAWTDKK